MCKVCKFIRRLFLLGILFLLCMGGFAEGAGAVSAAKGAQVSEGLSGQKLQARLTRKKKKKTSRTWSGSETERQNGAGDGSETEAQSKAKNNSQTETETEEIREEGTYTSKEEVALYLHLFGHLPDNYITKNEARDLGWVSAEGNLDEVAPGKSIGGDRFGNYEGQLPEKKGRKYFECDIDYKGGFRGSKRIIYSNDGLVYYTEDHYTTFELLYEA